MAPAARERKTQARHARRVRQAQHEAAKEVITWAVDNRIGALAVGDPRGVLHLKAGRRHNQRTRDWRVGHLIRTLSDKAEAAGIIVRLVDERGTSSTCPHCGQAGTATSSRPPASPPEDLAAAPSPPSQPGRESRTVAPELISPVCTPRGVTRGAGPHHGPHPAGTWPAPARPPPRQTAANGESLAATRGARNEGRDNPRPTYGQVH